MEKPFRLKTLKKSHKDGFNRVSWHQQRHSVSEHVSAPSPAQLRTEVGQETAVSESSGPVDLTRPGSKKIKRKGVMRNSAPEGPELRCLTDDQQQSVVKHDEEKPLELSLSQCPEPRCLTDDQQQSVVKHDEEKPLELSLSQCPEPRCLTDDQQQSVMKHDKEKTVELGLSQYSIELVIDTDSAHRHLRLTDSNRRVMCMRDEQPNPDHPGRFDVFLQLLCRNALTGRYYWEVGWRGWVEISVSYSAIGRKGGSDDCRFGFNAQSWTLECSDNVGGYSVQHSNIRTELPLSSPVSNRAAIYVDHPAGTLSFYRISAEELIHLHTFNTTFTEPLYAGFGLLVPGSSVSLC